MIIYFFNFVTYLNNINMEGNISINTGIVSVSANKLNGTQSIVVLVLMVIAFVVVVFK